MTKNKRMIEHLTSVPCFLIEKQNFNTSPGSNMQRRNLNKIVNINVFLCVFSYLETECNLLLEIPAY